MRKDCPRDRACRARRRPTPFAIPMISPLLKSLALALLCGGTLFAATAPSKIKVMLLTGQSNRFHDWTKSSPLVQRALEETGLFAVDLVTSPTRGADMAGFAPKFSDYAAVVMIYEGDEWPDATKQAFVDYMKNGGGLVTIHDTDNAFPYWPEWNEMIGVGGWGFKKDGSIGARNDTFGPKIRWRDDKMVLDTASRGTSGHPPRHDFVVTTRTPEHPVMKGLPAAWLHANDEIYSNLRGPAKNVTVLATAMADPERFAKNGGTGENEPMLMAISYGKGRVFHSTLGHVSPNEKPPYTAIECAGFIVTVQRGTEWAATGKVTQAVPKDFPTAEKTSMRAEK